MSPTAVGRWVIAAALALTVTGPAAAAAAAPSTRVAVLGTGLPGTITDRYIVVLKDGAAEAREVPRSARALAGRFGGTVHAAYQGGVRGFTARMSRDGATRLAAHPAVAFVEQDRVVRTATTQAGPTWGLDRIDQRALPLSRSYTYPHTGEGVTAYVLDTGVRTSHREFGGRARSGYDVVDADADAGDCHGHGTHVAGTIAGATHGVAKRAAVVAVRVLDCAGTGSYSAIIAGVDWVTRHAVRPAVANLSLGGGASAALDAAVRTSVAAGVAYVVAAGNSGEDACTGSPARTAEALTVGATDAVDGRAAFSNVGTCLDLFAPGVGIVSAGHSGDAATASMSGTSMAAPHVTGAAALFLAAHPGATAAQVHAALMADATTGAVRDPGAGSPNRLLYTGTQPAPGCPAPTPTPPAPCT